MSTTKKLTITVDEQVYRALHKVIGRGYISRFINNLVKPYILKKDLKKAYQAMAKDEKHEKEALEWIEGTLIDLPHETW